MLSEPWRSPARRQHQHPESHPEGGRQSLNIEALMCDNVNGFKISSNYTSRKLQRKKKTTKKKYLEIYKD